MARKSMSGAATALVEVAQGQLDEARKQLDEAKNEPNPHLRNQLIAEAKANIASAQRDLDKAKYHGRE